MDKIKKHRVKKQFGEVLTPPTLVNEMLDKLPKDIWYDKDKKWLDPCSGRNGIFPIEVYKRLMDTLTGVIEDDIERDNHIWNNMLYMVEIQEDSVLEMTELINNEIRVNGNDNKLNIYYGSFLDEGFDKYSKEVWDV